MKKENKISETMKAIKCELCGSNELVKQDDYFVCQFCGTKYTPEAAKKLIIDLNNPIQIKGINNIEDDLNNVASLIQMGQLHKAEILLEKLSISATNNPNVWVMYAKFSYAKYIEGNNYSNYRKECTHGGGTRSVYNNPKMGFNDRCIRCVEELHKHERFLIKGCPEDTGAIQQIQELIQKVETLSKENQSKAQKVAAELIESFYTVPNAYTYNSTFSWIDKNGTFYTSVKWVNNKPKLIPACLDDLDYEGRHKWPEIYIDAFPFLEAFIAEGENNAKLYSDVVSSLNEKQKISFVKCFIRHIAPSANIPSDLKALNIASINGRTIILRVSYDSDTGATYSNSNFTPEIQIKGNFEQILDSVKAESVKGGCYIATCVYGSYDCPEVWRLRRFRDNQLSKTWCGKTFISTYYAISPTLVKWFGDTAWFKKTWKAVIDRIVIKLKDKGFEDTPYKDK